MSKQIRSSRILNRYSLREFSDFGIACWAAFFESGDAWYCIACCAAFFESGDAWYGLLEFLYQFSLLEFSDFVAFFESAL